MTRPLTDLLARAEWPDPVLDPDAVAGWPDGALDRFRGLGLLAECGPAGAARCDACGIDHVEPVRWVDGPGPGRRGYILCPHEGAVRVTPDALRRWAVQFTQLAQLVAAAVGAAGPVRECFPGRAWRLGTVRTSGRAWPTFLLAGLSRPDAGGVVVRVAELRSPAVLVCVPSLVPPPAVWAAGRPPTVIPLTDLFDLGPDGLRADPLVLESALAPAGRPARPAPTAFPTPAGATWEQVRLTVEDLHLTVRVGGVTRRLSFAAAGFEERRRKGVPNRGWHLLTALARCGGVLGTGDRISTKPAALKAGVSNLRVCLRTLLRLDGDPFRPVKKGQHYCARFRIESADPSHVPIPPGAGWEDVSLAETPAGTIEVTVAVTGGGPVRCPAGGGGPTGREYATDTGEWTRVYRLADWNIADPAGSPTPAGTALLATLRGRGRVRRPAADPGMLALGKVLTATFGIEGPPFTFDPTARTWVSGFAAGCRVSAPDR